MLCRDSFLFLAVLSAAALVDARAAQDITTASSVIASTSASPSAEPTASALPNFCGTGYIGNGKCGWVFASSTRSTYSIIWSCLAVILLCTYKVIRLHTCSAEEHVASWRERPFYSRKPRKLLYMGMTVIAPEGITGIAYAELEASRSVRRQMISRGYRWLPGWPTSQSTGQLTDK
ncbi:uncharacterized protein LY89DRAFT_679590 [Mollisia scopiformis]|uniref:Uncharacterized protein n=1 Tax=Mollisia scopiformis TaxID=149040 RepID=A0A194XW41_MOLSC|nr:uncharacterized protein LY89DRAFT_679590 [Mollisia scopiformis]KUJ24453.1 hypothetical protein LY89DRAFT_679590 [Mollisia scopiformis]